MRIERCYGTSTNTVNTQVSLPISFYALIAIIREQLNLTASMHALLQILPDTLFEKVHLQRALDENAAADFDLELVNRLNFFDS